MRNKGHSRPSSVIIPVNTFGILLAMKQAQNQIPACQTQTTGHKPLLTYLHSTAKARKVTLLGLENEKRKKKKKKIYIFASMLVFKPIILHTIMKCYVKQLNTLNTLGI